MGVTRGAQTVRDDASLATPTAVRVRGCGLLRDGRSHRGGRGRARNHHGNSISPRDTIMYRGTAGTLEYYLVYTVYTCTVVFVSKWHDA